MISAYALAVARRPPVDSPSLGLYRAGDAVSVKHARPFLQAGVPDPWVLVPVFGGANGRVLDFYLLRPVSSLSYEALRDAELHAAMYRRNQP